MEFECVEEDRYFIASLVWRAIAERLLEGTELRGKYPDRAIARMDEAERALRAYLLGNASYPGDIEQHVFFSDPTAEGPYPGMNTYLTAANDLQIIGIEDRLYCYASLGGILIISPLHLPETGVGEWGADTRLLPSSKLRAGNQTIADAHFGGILAYAARRMEEGKALMSPRQRAKVRDAMADVDADDFAKSPHGRAMLRDLLNQAAMQPGDAP